MAKLRMAHASTHGARKPPGPKPHTVSSLYSTKDANSNLPPTSGWMYDEFLSDPSLRVKLVGESLVWKVPPSLC